MTNRIVSYKEFCAAVRPELVAVCDFSQKKSKHILGIGARQMRIEVALDVIRAVAKRFEDEGRTLDKDLIELRTPKGERRFASAQLNLMAKVRLSRGASVIETLWKSFGDLIVVARRGSQNVYVAKNGATDFEFTSVIELRTGKLNARVHDNEELTEEVTAGRRALGGRPLGEVYAETCTEYFKHIQAAE